MGRRALFICICIFGCLAASLDATADRRVALVIGNARYEHAAPLNNPLNDADAVSDALERLNFTVIRGTDLSREEMIGKVREFARLMRGASTGLFYYSGHGLQIAERNYLVPIDAELDEEADLDFEAVTVDTVIKQMEREPSTNLIFLDACRDNPMARNLARNMGTRSTSIGRGLARIDSGVGTLIAFSTQPGNVALDGEEGANSPFTTALLDHIETPNVDISRVLRRVRQDVIKSTDGRQVPWSSSSLIGDFFFSTEVATSTQTKERPGKNEEVSALRKRLEQLEQQLASKQQPDTEDETDAVVLVPTDKDVTSCDRLASDPADPRAKGFGVPLAHIAGATAVQACEAAVLDHPSSAVLNYQLARSYIASSKAPQAVPVLQRLADGDDAVAMTALAQLLIAGNGVSRDLPRALRLLRKAAEQDLPVASSLLGFLYETGVGVPQDTGDAIANYRHAAERGDIHAMKALSRLLEPEFGRGGDVAEAVRWADLAANHETALSQLALARMMDTGDGAVRNPLRAAKTAHAALRSANSLIGSRLKRSQDIWSQSFWKALQRLLKVSGHYSGPVNGKVGDETWAAINAAGSE